MKKTYVKPEVYFENFELSANIAAGCSVKINLAEGVCSSIPGIGSIFTDYTTCTFTAGDNESGNSEFNYCYHIPLDSKRVFTS